MPSIGPGELLLPLLFALAVAPFVIAGMKGRWIWFVLGILVWPLAIVGAVLPAKPGSAWARRRAR